MIIMTTDTHVVVGLSARNLELLRAGKPIRKDLASVGHALTLVIFHGETEDIMREQLGELVGPDTVILDERSKPS